MVDPAGLNSAGQITPQSEQLSPQILPQQTFETIVIAHKRSFNRTEVWQFLGY